MNQYVELGGVVGIFVKLDANSIDQHTLENLLHATQQQVQNMSKDFFLNVLKTENKLFMASSTMHTNILLLEKNCLVSVKDRRKEEEWGLGVGCKN